MFDLDAIEAAEKVMTPAPWKLFSAETISVEYQCDEVCYCGEEGDDEAIANAAGIVLFRNSTPEMVARIREQDTEIARLRAEIADLLATAEREAKLRDALRSCLSCMEIQEHREDESFHLSVEAFRPMWDEAKANAVAALESKGGE